MRRPASRRAKHEEVSLDEASARPSSAYAPHYSRKRAIALKITVVARLLRRRFDAVVVGDGLTRAKWSLIVAVARNPGATQRSIAAMLEISEVSAGQLIDRLCADGYIERREHPTDRRAYCVHLTEASEPLLARLGQVAELHEAETFVGLSEEDLIQLEAMLDTVSRNITAAIGRRDEITSERTTVHGN
jgi:MarR family transcriptional regulator, transcriptional regulator for hemolysin